MLYSCSSRKFIDSLNNVSYNFMFAIEHLVFVVGFLKCMAVMFNVCLGVVIKVVWVVKVLRDLKDIYGQENEMYK